MEFGEAVTRLFRYKRNPALGIEPQVALAYEKELALAVDAVAELKGNPRDEYHTMDELYHYRMLYNALALYGLSSQGALNCGRSRRHHDGELCFNGEYFIVWVELLTGMVTNHYKIEDEKYFLFLEGYEKAPEWDGHTPAEAAKRMEKMLLHISQGAATE
ncbi:MAG TPA: hypothetical protein PKD68_05050 [Candidatus Saccharibacteria bacterium]|nr:hypothetical protein [Candidatus Saccharibacteria bacterium]